MHETLKPRVLGESSTTRGATQTLIHAVGCLKTLQATKEQTKEQKEAASNEPNVNGQTDLQVYEEENDETMLALCCWCCLLACFCCTYDDKVQASRKSTAAYPVSRPVRQLFASRASPFARSQPKVRRSGRTCPIVGPFFLPRTL